MLANNSNIDDNLSFYTRMLTDFLTIIRQFPTVKSGQSVAIFKYVLLLEPRGPSFF